jgi:hypothetical protein
MRVLMICWTMLMALVVWPAMAERMVLDCSDAPYGFGLDTDRNTVTERRNLPGEQNRTAPYSETEDAVIWRWKYFRDQNHREELQVTYTLDTHTLLLHQNYSCRGCESPSHDWSHNFKCQLLRKQFP